MICGNGWLPHLIKTMIIVPVKCKKSTVVYVILTIPDAGICLHIVCQDCIGLSFYTECGYAAQAKTLSVMGMSTCGWSIDNVQYLCHKLTNPDFNTNYVPFQIGGRFSRNAAMPSF